MQCQLNDSVHQQSCDSRGSFSATTKVPTAAEPTRPLFFSARSMIFAFKLLQEAVELFNRGNKMRMRAPTSPVLRKRRDQLERRHQMTRC